MHYYFCCLFLCGYYSRAVFISLESPQTLMTVHTSNTVMTVRCCQLYAQPLSSTVSHGNESYNTDSPSASLVTVISNYSQPCSFAVYTSHSYYSRVATILFKEIRCVYTICLQLFMHSGLFCNQCNLCTWYTHVWSKPHTYKVYTEVLSKNSSDHLSPQLR